MSQPQAAPPVQDVRVVNRPAEPVPTAAQGVTQVSGHVTVDNELNVKVTNMPTVHIARSNLEYRIEELPNLGNPGSSQAMVTALNGLGAQGWDFIQFVPADRANINAGLFKRVK